MREPATSSSPTPAPDVEKGRRSRIGSWRFSTVELLISLVLLFVISPLVQTVRHGQSIEAALMTLVLIAAVFAVGGRRRTLFFTVLIATPAVVFKWLHHFHPHLYPEWLYLSAALGFMAFVIVNLLRFMLAAPRVDFDVLCASICAYLLLGILWALAYTLVAQANPNAFHVHIEGAPDLEMRGLNAFYFSFVTLSTVGYGDILPLSPVARMLAALEAMTGPLYLAILIARLVALYSVPPRRGRSDPR